MRLNAHRYVIMQRLLERGSWAEINWLFEAYGERAVRDWVRRWGFRALSPRSFALWRLVLGIRNFRTPSWARTARTRLSE